MEVENCYIWKVAIIGGVKNPWLWQEGYTKLIPAISSVLWFFQTNGSNRHVMRSFITTQTKQRHFCGKQISFLNFPGFWVLCYLFSCITVGSAEPPAPTLTPGAWFAPEPLAQKMIDIWHWQSTCCLSIHQDSTTTWRCAAQILQFARLWIWKLTVKLRKSKPLPNFHISSTNHNLFLAWWKSCSWFFRLPASGDLDVSPCGKCHETPKKYVIDFSPPTNNFRSHPTVVAQSSGETQAMSQRPMETAIDKYLPGIIQQISLLERLHVFVPFCSYHIAHDLINPFKSKVCKLCQYKRRSPNSP